VLCNKTIFYYDNLSTVKNSFSHDDDDGCDSINHTIKIVEKENFLHIKKRRIADKIDFYLYGSCFWCASYG
jgi:hypothetical protein